MERTLSEKYRHAMKNMGRVLTRRNLIVWDHASDTRRPLVMGLTSLDEWKREFWHPEPQWSHMTMRADTPEVEPEAEGVEARVHILFTGTSQVDAEKHKEVLEYCANHHPQVRHVILVHAARLTPQVRQIYNPRLGPRKGTGTATADAVRFEEWHIDELQYSLVDHADQPVYELASERDWEELVAAEGSRDKVLKNLPKIRRTLPGGVPEPVCKWHDFRRDDLLVITTRNEVPLPCFAVVTD
jgi:hypothetical protein